MYVYLYILFKCKRERVCVCLCTGYTTPTLSYMKKWDFFCVVSENLEFRVVW